MQASVSDDSTQIDRIKTLDILIDEKLQALQQSIALRDAAGFEAAKVLEIAMMEKATMDSIRRIIGDVTESEKAALALRQTKVDRDETRIRVVAILVGLASFLTRSGIELYLAKKASGSAARQEDRRPA